MRNHQILMLSADLLSGSLSSQTSSLLSILSLENLLCLKALFAKYIIRKRKLVYTAVKNKTSHVSSSPIMLDTENF